MFEPIGPIWPSLASVGWAVAAVEFALIRHQLKVVRVARQSQVVTTADYTIEEQAAYCANYCAGEHHAACARRTEDGGPGE